MNVALFVIIFIFDLILIGFVTYLAIKLHDTYETMSRCMKILAKAMDEHWRLLSEINKKIDA